MKKFEVEMTITKTYTTKVFVEGDFTDFRDSNIDEAAVRAADNMNHDLWNYEDTEYSVISVTLVS
ncbi:hypothetical protein ACFQZE_06775 [Paenibacillus sp. GCM10027627]|uniref:hypothetical protein n=1 Tax=unclassified Paenibacillus TaxID=185978 RepID=UPI003635A048